MQAVFVPVSRLSCRQKQRAPKPFVPRASDGIATYFGESRLADRHSAVTEASSAETTHVHGDRDTINATYNIVFVTAEVGALDGLGGQHVGCLHRAQAHTPSHAKGCTSARIALHFFMSRISSVRECLQVAPWSKTGGLGDVCGSLPPALAARGHRVMVVAPRYADYDVTPVDQVKS